MQPEVVSRSDAQKQQYVVFGTIKDTNRVTIEDDREGGAIAGAAIGGKIGKEITDSEPEQDIATVLGASAMSINFLIYPPPFAIIIAAM